MTIMTGTSMMSKTKPMTTPMMKDSTPMTTTLRRHGRPVLVSVSLIAWAAVVSGRFDAQQAPPAPPAPHVIDVSAERFAFTPSEIKVKAGTPLEFRLRSDDTSHGFRILDTSVNVRIPKRGKGVTTVVFEPPKPGRYTFECSKLCGAGHSFMRGTLIVTE